MNVIQTSKSMQDKLVHRFKSLVFLPVLLVVLLASVANAAEDPAKRRKEFYDNLKIMSEVYERVINNYVDEKDPKDIMEGAIKGMLEGLDEHSNYLPPRNYEDLVMSTEGEFGGVGIEVTLEDNKLLVIAPIEDTPADLAGVKAGDVIVKIDGIPVLSDNLSRAVERMRGDIGSKITLTIVREGANNPLNIEITRDVIQLTSVRTRDLGEPGFAYMRISSFQSGTAKSLRNKIEKYTREHGEITGFILDLRNNPGGILLGAVDVSDLFLSTGTM